MKAQSKEKIIEEFRIESIQEAAVRVIARKGLAGASMNEIAEEAGISKGTIYLYFQNQRDLIEKTVDRAFGALHEALAAALDGSGSYLDRLRKMIAVQFGFLAANADLLRIYVEMQFPQGLDAASVRCERSSRPHFRQHQERFVRFLTAAVESGEIRPLDPRRLAVFLQDGLMGVLVVRMQEKNPRPADEDVEILMSVILNGIASPVGGKKGSSV